MKCELCQNTATVHVIETDGAAAVEHHYCQTCASRLQLAGVPVSPSVDPAADPFLNRPIGRVLEKMGKVSRGQVAEALTIQKSRSGMGVGELLVDLGYITRDDLTLALARQRGSVFRD